jgi:predicted RNA-binding protein with PIN domain
VTQRVLVVDGANVVGSRPDGWWRDRAGAAARLHEGLLAVELDYDTVLLVLEGQARTGVPAGRVGSVETVHAERDGDSTIAREALQLIESGAACDVVTADRALAADVEHAGAHVQRPRWLWDLLDEATNNS